MTAPPAVRLSTAVMTHPSRAASARALADRFPELGAEVVPDPEPDGPPTALRASLAAWAKADPDAATHHLVLQDDALPVENFPARLTELIEHAPDAALCLFTEWGSRTSHAIRLAALLGHTLAPVVDDYTPCVALVLPAEAARGFESYARAKADASAPDDVALLNYLADRGIRTLIPVANLVDHHNDVSLVGNNVMGIRSAACLPPDRHPRTGPYTLLTGLDAIPYYDFWGQFADVCVPDDSLVDGWRRTSARVWLEQRGIAHKTVLEALDRALDRSEQGAFLRDRISEVVLGQLWTVAFLTGVIGAQTARRSGDPLDPDAPLAAAALSTFGPGAIRRVVPAARLAALGQALSPLVTEAVRAGAAAEQR